MKTSDTPNSSPIFRSISFSEASGFSPWPDRILGFDNWKKTRRNGEDILSEYDQGWYKSLLDTWSEHFQSGPSSPLSFFHRIIKEQCDETERNYEIYRTRQREALFSVGDSLAVGDLVLIAELFRLMVVRFVEELAARFGASGVVETGCGAGINLFFLNALAGMKPFVGGEICPNAVRVGNSIAGDLSLPGKFLNFDYRDPSSLRRLVEGMENYVLMTCHSIEQVQVRETAFVDSILALKNRPSVVIHIEPIQWRDEGFYARLCERYGALNLYNQDLKELLAEKEAEGRIQIVEQRKRCFGISAFNPSSLIAWRPR